MSSDYITRLRSELLRAGAETQLGRSRRRVARRVRPVAAAVAVAALLALAVVLTLPGGSDETAVDLPAATERLSFRIDSPDDAAAADTAELLRARLAAAGIEGADVRVGSDSTLTIAAPEGAREAVTALTATGRLAIYDWERSVLGPAPPRAVTRAEAEARAAERSGARVVRAIPTEPGGWYALAGEPALTGADVAGAVAAADDSSGEPAVMAELTPAGETAFEALTAKLARRGSDQGGGMEAFQHLAIVLDDRLLALPLIDYRAAPGGIDGSEGVQIMAGSTPQGARNLAAIVSTGPLPVTLSDPAARP